LQITSEKVIIPILIQPYLLTVVDETVHAHLTVGKYCRLTSEITDHKKVALERNCSREKKNRIRFKILNQICSCPYIWM
jgi:hypothetical protein